jgi:hypothetical protein
MATLECLPRQPSAGEPGLNRARPTRRRKPNPVSPLQPGRSWRVLLGVAIHEIECHSRFGRGRGNGTARRSTAVLCTSVVSWVEAGLRKAAIGSVGGGLGTEAALGIEPVTSSLAGASLPPLVLFRIAKKPNTRIATTAIPCRVRRLGVSQGTTKRCCIIEPPVSPWRRAGWEFYSTGA